MMTKNNQLKQETCALFEQISEQQLTETEVSEMIFNLYGFAKALTKAKMEIDEDKNETKTRKL